MANLLEVSYYCRYCSGPNLLTHECLAVQEIRALKLELIEARASIQRLELAIEELTDVRYSM